MEIVGRSLNVFVWTQATNKMEDRHLIAGYVTLVFVMVNALAKKCEPSGVLVVHCRSSCLSNNHGRTES